jgi:hypothetical protein
LIDFFVSCTVSTIIFASVSSDKKNDERSQTEWRVIRRQSGRRNQDELQTRYCKGCLVSVAHLGRPLDPSGHCPRCSNFLRVAEISQRVPWTVSISEARGHHSKPCSDCGYIDWRIGKDWYAVKSFFYRTSDKYCLDCAETKIWETYDDTCPKCWGRIRQSDNDVSQCLKCRNQFNQVKEAVNVHYIEFSIASRFVMVENSQAGERSARNCHS